MKATLLSTGFLITGPTITQFATTENLQERIEIVLAAENANKSPDTPEFDRDDLAIREQFTKTWCGPIDLSEEGVANLKSWDEAFRDDAVKAELRTSLSSANAAWLPLENSGYRSPPVVALMLGCPDWFTEQMVETFRRIIEMPIQIKGLQAGYSAIGASCETVIGLTDTVEIRVAELSNLAITHGVEAALLHQRCIDKSQIGPFQILFFEPDHGSNGVHDAWYCDALYFQGPFLYRDAGRNLQEADQTGKGRTPSECNWIHTFTVRSSEAFQYGPKTRMFASLHWDRLNQLGTNPNPLPVVES